MAEKLAQKLTPQPTSGEDDGTYVKVVYTKGGIELYPTEQLKQEVAQGGPQDEQTYSDIFELMEDFFTNGWENVRPEDIGALTDGEIFADPNGNIYWHERYQIEDMVQMLKNGEKVFMQYGGNLYEDEAGNSTKCPNCGGDVEYVQNTPLDKRSLRCIGNKDDGTGPCGWTGEAKELAHRDQMELPLTGSRRAGKRMPSAKNAAPKPKAVGLIEDETPILPHVVADAVIHELALYFYRKFKFELPNTQGLADQLSKQAQQIYAHNEQFRKKLKSKGNAGRDYLYAFMRHWLSGLVKDTQPAMFDKIPADFRVGKPIQEVHMASKITPAALREKMAARKAEREQAKVEKFAKLRRLAEENPQQVENDLNALAEACGNMAEAFENLKENLDLVKAAGDAALKVRIAAAKKYGKGLKRVAAENPELFEGAINEAWNSLDEVAEKLEELAEHAGVEIHETPAEAEIADEGREEEVAPAIVDEAREEGESVEHEMAEKAEGEDEEKEASGSDPFVTDRDENGQPKAPVQASGSDNFVTDRNEQGKPAGANKMEIPQAQGESEQNKSAKVTPASQKSARGNL
jgi:DNA-binding ferritin-like protein